MARCPAICGVCSSICGATLLSSDRVSESLAGWAPLTVQKRKTLLNVRQGTWNKHGYICVRFAVMVGYEIWPHQQVARPPSERPRCKAISRYSSFLIVLHAIFIHIASTADCHPPIPPLDNSRRRSNLVAEPCVRAIPSYPLSDAFDCGLDSSFC